MSYTVRAGETLASIAFARNMQASELAAANGLPVGAELEPGQRLDLPESAETASTPPESAAERTDAAYAEFEAATANADGTPESEATVAQTRETLDAAVAAEISPNVNSGPHHIPGAPSGQQTIDSYRTAILDRHADDPAAQQALAEAVGNYEVEYRADIIAQSGVYGSSVTPADQLAHLGDQLEGEPQPVIDAVLRQPSVQRRIDAAVEYVEQPYADVAPDQVRHDYAAAFTASERLAAATDGMPPAFAAAVVERSLPTIGKIASVDANYSGSGAYTNVSRAVSALGEHPQAQALTTQVAQAYLPQYETWSGRFSDPNGGIVRNAVADGAGTSLSIELARQIEAGGNGAGAGVVLRAAAAGVGDLQHDLDQKIEDYGEHTAELATLIRDAGPNMTPEQLQQAIDAYIAGKDQAWRDRTTELQQGIVADGKTLLEAMGALTSLPPELADAAPDVRDTLADIGTSETTQAGLEFALSLDPSILASPEAGSAATFLADIGQKGSDFVKSLGNAYVTGRIMPAIAAHNPLDPASVARTNAALNDLQANGARFLGIPQHEIDDGVARLRSLSTALGDPHAPRLDGRTAVNTIEGLDNVKANLVELQNTTFSTGPAAVAFRTLALGMAGGAFLTSARTTIDDPNAQNVIGTLAYSVGLAQDASAFAATIGVINAEGRAATWGTGTSMAGRFTTKFVGVLNAAYFVAGAVDQANQGSVPGVLFNAAGAGGALLATFGSAAGLGSWAGPVGVGVMILATAGVELVKYRQNVNAMTDAAEAFYRGGGVDEGAIEALADEAAGPAGQLREGLGLSPEQMQQLAASHPDIFRAPGYANAIVDVLQANGIDADHAVEFLDALRKDDPAYAHTFLSLQSNRQSGHEAAHAQLLRSIVQGNYPAAAAIVREQSPELFGAAAEQRDRAVADYESLPSADAANIGNLLKKHDAEPDYKVEIIRQMAEDGMLDVFVEQTATLYAYNGWPEAARAAIIAAREEGVLDASQTLEYLNQLS